MTTGPQTSPQTNHSLGNVIVAVSLVLAGLAAALMIMNPGSGKKVSPAANSAAPAAPSSEPTPPQQADTPQQADSKVEQEKEVDVVPADASGS